MNYESPMEESQVEASPADTNQTTRLLSSINLAEDLDEDKLTEIGKNCKDGFDRDLQSRSDWEKDLEEWTRLAMQIRETKTFPWPKASNVKYPLLSTAAMQFAARAYPSLVPSNGKVVVGKVIGKDPTGEKLAKATRVATYMSWQVMYELCGWEEDMDKLLMMLPIIGTVFKKTWSDGATETIASCLVGSTHLVADSCA